MFFVDTGAYVSAIAWVILPVALVFVVKGFIGASEEPRKVDTSKWSEADRIEYLERNFK